MTLPADTNLNPLPPGRQENDAAERLAKFAADFPAWQYTEEINDLVRTLLEEREELRWNVLAFCAPWAAKCAQDHGLPEGHLFAQHFDILERAGARMVDFTRHPEGASDA